MSRIKIAFLFMGLAATSAGHPIQAENISAVREPAALTGALSRFLGAPFREDGALNQAGQWATFNHPEQISEQPGFNCSGFTVTAARELLGRNFNLTEVSCDRRGDSGPGAGLGQDWDFGLDIILNLAEDYPHRFLPEPENPEGPPLMPLRPGRSLGWGVSLHGQEFEALLKRLQPGNFAFFTFSKPNGRFPAGVSYYHTGVIIPEPPHIWLYHSTLGAKTNRVDLASTEGLTRLRRHFKPITNGERRVFMIEVSPPPAAAQ